MSRRFQDRSVVVIGENPGVALACVSELLAEGAHIHALSGDRGELGPLQQSHPRQLHWVPTDLAERASIVTAFDRIAECCQRVDALVLDVARMAPGLFEELTEDDVMSGLLAGVAGPIYCLQRGASLMRGGRVVYISPPESARNAPAPALPAAVRAALEALMSSVRGELYRARGIQLTVLGSGPVAGLSAAPRSPQRAPQASAVSEMEAVPLSMDHVVRCILFALSLPRDAALHAMDLQSADIY